jgi:hypothetical protein
MINISHIRQNTADTDVMQKNEIHQSIVTSANPFNKPPKVPINQERLIQQQQQQ